MSAVHATELSRRPATKADAASHTSDDLKDRQLQRADHADADQKQQSLAPSDIDALVELLLT